MEIIPLGLFGSFGCIGLLATIFWIVALVDCVKREFDGENEKLVWILVIVLAQGIGAIVYWFVGRDKGRLVG